MGSAHVKGYSGYFGASGFAACNRLTPSEFRSGISVTDFLLSLDPNVTTATTILSGYLVQLDVAAENIANWI